MAKEAKSSKEKHDEMVPKKWEGAFSLYQYSKNVVYYNWQTILVIYLVVSVLGAATYPFAIAGNALSIIISAIGSVAVTIAYLHSFKHKKIEVGKAVSMSWPLVVNMVILEILVGLTLIASFLALVIPFFFIAPRFAIANFYVIDKKMGAVDAYKASWEATRGQLGKIYGIVGVNLLLALLFITIIGIPFAVYMLFFYSAAFAVLYKYIDGHEK